MPNGTNFAPEYGSQALEYLLALQAPQRRAQELRAGQLAATRGLGGAQEADLLQGILRSQAEAVGQAATRVGLERAQAQRQERLIQEQRAYQDRLRKEALEEERRRRGQSLLMGLLTSGIGAAAGIIPALSAAKAQRQAGEAATTAAGESTGLYRQLLQYLYPGFTSFQTQGRSPQLPLPPIPTAIPPLPGGGGAAVPSLPSGLPAIPGFTGAQTSQASPELEELLLSLYGGNPVGAFS